MGPNSVQVPGLSSSVVLALAVLSLLVPVVTTLLPLMFNRGGRSRPVPLDPEVVIPRQEYDKLLERVADLDEQNARTRDEWRDEVLSLREQLLSVSTELAVARARLADRGDHA